MLATFVIGLREGLEAALIVGIIAAFLRKNGKSLVPMIIGVVAAVFLSLCVGVGLRVVERSLPQAAQEGMETIIGAVAIVFVTGMVLWMSTHSRGLKAELEASAGEALGAGSSRALVAMAFLAVLKEGFETAVFLLATFSAASNALLAATGAVVGVAVAVVIGFGLYRGGIRLNLGRFFAGTGIFLLLVAAGLVVTALGTAHEAGWLNAGQQRTVDLGWLSPPGSVRGALFTGVLGIPSDPRLIQVVGWLAYLVPMALYLFWPRRHRPSAAAGVRIRIGVAAALVVGAVVLAVVVRPATMPDLGAARLLDAAGQPAGTVTLDDGGARVTIGTTTTTIPLIDASRGAHGGVPDAVGYRQQLDEPTQGLPHTLSLTQLVQLNGGRLPVGVSPQQAPGPFRAAWTRSGQQELWLAGGQILDFTRTDATTVTLTGGGLATSRTLTVTGPVPGGVVVSGGSVSADPARVTAVAQAAAATRSAGVEHRFWGRVVPVALVAAAVIVLLVAWRARRRLRPSLGAVGAEPVIEARSKAHA